VWKTECVCGLKAEGGAWKVIHDMARYDSWMMLLDATNRYFERHLEQGPRSR
jgi:hypothetical protein